MVQRFNGQFLVYDEDASQNENNGMEKSSFWIQRNVLAALHQVLADVLLGEPCLIFTFADDCDMTGNEWMNGCTSNILRRCHVMAVSCAVWSATLTNSYP